MTNHEFLEMADRLENMRQAAVTDGHNGCECDANFVCPYCYYIDALGKAAPSLITVCRMANTLNEELKMCARTETMQTNRLYDAEDNLRRAIEQAEVLK
jgi:hypothetical protein